MSTLLKWKLGSGTRQSARSTRVARTGQRPLCVELLEERQMLEGDDPSGDALDRQLAKHAANAQKWAVIGEEMGNAGEGACTVAVKAGEAARAAVPGLGTVCTGLEVASGQKTVTEAVKESSWDWVCHKFEGLIDGVVELFDSDHVSKAVETATKAGEAMDAISDHLEEQNGSK